MKKEFISGRNGYDIPCLNNLTGDEKLAVIIIHGFGGSKEGSTARTIAAVLPKHGIGTYSFDFPAHGESPVDGGMLRIENCLNDLAAVEARVQQSAPKAQIAYFSSSFGAYINLIYLAAREHAGRKAFLRCAAVDMAGIFRQNTMQEQYARLDAQGFIMLDMAGYIRPLKITREFLADLDAYDVFKLCRPGMAELAMIHGTVDEVASIDGVRRFSKQFGAMLTEVEGADHSFLIPGGTERVIDTAVKFFTSRLSD
ncbi:MAG: alpha/beta hydrolase [Bacillota bacterium]